jgi:N6-L-threonylcarbamoyladenine synthase
LKKRASLDFSFSGLKTSLLYHLRDLDKAGQPRPVADLAAGFQEAIVEVLVEKAFTAVARQKVEVLAVVGGVSANSRLRAVLAARAARTGIRLALPPPAYSTDNAAMIAAAGRRAYLQGRFASWDLEAEATLPVPAAARSGDVAGLRATRQPVPTA